MAVKTSTELRADSPGVMAFARDLEYREAEVIEQTYPEKKAADGKVMQIEEQEIPWALTTSFKMTAGVGSFELADDMTSNLPYVDVVGQEFRQDVKSYRSGYRYSEKEIAAFDHLGIPIDAQRISTVREAYMQTLNRLILFGDRKTGHKGFTNHPAFLRGEAPFRLDGSVTNANQLIATLTYGCEAIDKATNGAVEVDTIWLPKSRYTYLNTQARMDNTLEMSVLRYFQENSPTSKKPQIGFLRELENAGPRGEAIAVFYCRNPRHLKARITDPFRFRQLQVYPYFVYRPVSFDWNGLQVYTPNCAFTMVGI